MYAKQQNEVPQIKEESSATKQKILQISSTDKKELKEIVYHELDYFEEDAEKAWYDGEKVWNEIRNEIESKYPIDTWVAVHRSGKYVAASSEKEIDVKIQEAKWWSPFMKIIGRDAAPEVSQRAVHAFRGASLCTNTTAEVGSSVNRLYGHAYTNHITFVNDDGAEVSNIAPANRQSSMQKIPDQRIRQTDGSVVILPACRFFLSIDGLVTKVFATVGGVDNILGVDVLHRYLHSIDYRNVGAERVITLRPDLYDDV